MWSVGASGSGASSDPAGTTQTSVPGSCRGTGQPHSRQNDLPKRRAVASRYRDTADSPSIHANWRASTAMLVECAAPEPFRHRVQWQWTNLRNGGVSSNRTWPQRQLPWIGAAFTLRLATAYRARKNDLHSTG